MKKFCADLRKHATEIINCGKREMLPLIEEEEKLYKEKKDATYVSNNSITNIPEMKLLQGSGL